MWSCISLPDFDRSAFGDPRVRTEILSFDRLMEPP